MSIGYNEFSGMGGLFDKFAGIDLAADPCSGLREQIVASQASWEAAPSDTQAERNIEYQLLSHLRALKDAEKQCKAKAARDLAAAAAAPKSTTGAPPAVVKRANKEAAVNRDLAKIAYAQNNVALGRQYESKAQAAEAAAGITPKPFTKVNFANAKPAAKSVGVVATTADPNQQSLLQSLLLNRAVADAAQGPGRPRPFELLGTLAIDPESTAVKVALYGTVAVASIAGIALLTKLLTR